MGKEIPITLTTVIYTFGALPQINMETKIFSSTGFMHEFSTEELYVLTTHWLSDIVFFEQEIHYFQSLITRYFLPNVEEDNAMIIEGLQNQLNKLDVKKTTLRKGILEHQSKLSALLDQSHAETEAYFNAQNSNLEGELFDFIRHLRQVKLEFFTATKFSGETKRRELKPSLDSFKQ
ncbi:MAG: hypothetical protein H7Y07_15085 [Pyrinomonadaceae bacterium]|nr:hypothetical protein [Sphingobacteriaceae bacterium]